MSRHRPRDRSPPAPPAASSRLLELVSAGQVGERIEVLSGQIARDFSGKLPLFVVIAEGARRFAEALKRGVTARGVSVDVVEVRARRTQGTDLVEIALDDFDAKRCTAREVLVIDDIADEGRTLGAVLARVEAIRPQSVRTAVLVSKHARRKLELVLDYVGFDVSDGWIVGYGMDLDGRFRELDHLAVLDEDREARGDA